MTDYEMQKIECILRLLRHAHTALMQHYEHLQSTQSLQSPTANNKAKSA